MDNPLNSISNLPKPILAVSLLASGAGLATVYMAIASDNPAWRIAAAGLIGLGLVLALYKIVLMLRDKAKSSPFATMVSRAGGARAGTDPAAKARMDDLRKKFEEGVTAFKGAGKDLYSLPWYLLVGPSGSGKTEALRHSNVGFPPGLQDCLQGTGGTLNMHWWFTNHAVVLDTAGRMFMEEAAEGQSTEWKEFMKLLKTARPNCPINGLLLVISSESLLKDSSEKIERTAGAIARQLDVIQRTLEVRFPVTVVVTKCDKIIGFREFFETINDPGLQHQILGWSNPSPLDEAFKPDQVEKHMSGVRERLMKRRAGLLQNPVHTTDAHGRRTDEVDEMFELPDNLMRIAPRLRRYLEMIFVAGEWSPKPLFLRGIYFTSSMREGQALDVSLAQALGVDVESLPGGKEYDKEKAYFLRDVFLGKVFKERGLVTRASNVSKQLARQRAWVLGGSLAAAIIVGGVTAMSVMGYRSSLGPPSEFWSTVKPVFETHLSTKPGDDGARPLSLFAVGDGGNLKYIGGEKVGTAEALPEGVKTRAELVAETAEHTSDISLGWAGAPAAALAGASSKGYGLRQTLAHRAVVESTMLVPLLQTVREKLVKEQQWPEPAVKALAQLVRMHTLAEGAAPVDNPPVKAGRKSTWQLVDVAVLARYAMGEAEYAKMDSRELERLGTAVARAYPEGWPTTDGDKKRDEASEGLFGNSREYAWGVVESASKSLLAKLSEVKPGPGNDLGRLVDLCDTLEKFDAAETAYDGPLAWLAAESGGDSAAKASAEGYKQFAAEYRKKIAAVSDAKDSLDQKVGQFKKDEVANPTQLLAAAGEAMRKDIVTTLGVLRVQLPPKDAGATPPTLAKLTDSLDDKKASSEATKALEGVAKAIEATRGRLEKVAYLLTPGKADNDDARLYETRFGAHKIAGDVMTEADKPVADPKGVSTVMADRNKKLADDQDARGKKLDRLGQWAGGGLKAEQTRLQRSVTAATRASNIATGWARHNLIAAAMGEECWADSISVGKAAEKATQSLIDAGTVKQSALERPRLALTEMDVDPPSKFNSQFVPEGAIAILGAWAAIEGSIDSEAGAVVVAREELGKLPARAAGRRAATEYAKAYIDYWKNEALVSAKPNCKQWDAFSNAVKGLDQAALAGRLNQVKERCVGALEKMPPAMASAEALKSAIDEVKAAYAGVNGTLDFATRAKDELLDPWKSLASEKPKDARNILLRKYRAREAKETYFSGYVKSRSDSRYVLYFNEFLANGFDLLANASGDELDKAWAELIAARAVPLATGAATLPDLSPAQVASVREAASKIGGTEASGKQSSGGEDLGDSRLQRIMSRMAGEGYLKGDGVPEWFGKLQKSLKATEKPVKMSINFLGASRDGAPAPSGSQEAGGTYQYAHIWVGGEFKGSANIGNLLTLSAADAAQCVATIPGSASVEVKLFTDDPSKKQGIKTPPEATVMVGAQANGNASEWGPMRAILTDANSKFLNGKWIIAPKTADGRHYVLLVLDVNAETPLPAATEWPKDTDWPK
ncbi:MAG: hypothetical protein JSR77_11955 [Planctomycetes bacterium]|nr:hypothetical protein [Planctomycetota bacterium]